MNAQLKVDYLNREERENTLDEMKIGQEGIITSTPQQPLLAPLGVRPGKRIRIRARERFGGPVVSEVEGRRVALGLNLARSIRVVEIV